MNKYRNITFILIFVGMVSLLFGVTYSFFNYTKTGSANTISVGRIYFETTQGPNINLTNVFPVSRDDIDTETNYVGSVTINIKGDTSYDEGIEYLISAVDVVNTSGTTYTDIQKVPIGVDVSVSANGTGNTVGTENSNYFNEGVRGGDTSYYKIVAEDVIRDNGPLVVGYIAPDEDGIDGNIVIRAFIDEDKIAISDTYPPGEVYIFNPNMTESMINECVSYISSIGWNNYLKDGETLAGYCAGTGTVGGSTMQQDYNYGSAQRSRIDYFITHNYLIYTGDNATSTEWVNGRTVITTNNWNNLPGLSFKIKVEANEGIWVNDLGKISSCPNCQFLYYVIDKDVTDITEEDFLYTTWNTKNHAPTVITSGLSDNYLDIVNNYNTEMFFGVVLNESNQATRLYLCILKDDKPICMEATGDGSSYSSNLAIVQDSWNNTCQSGPLNTGNETFIQTECASESIYYPDIILHDHGCVEAAEVRSHVMMNNRLHILCDADTEGYFMCYRY